MVNSSKVNNINLIWEWRVLRLKRPREYHKIKTISAEDPFKTKNKIVTYKIWKILNVICFWFYAPFKFLREFHCYS